MSLDALLRSRNCGCAEDEFSTRARRGMRSCKHAQLDLARHESTQLRRGKSACVRSVENSALSGKYGASIFRGSLLAHFAPSLVVIKFVFTTRIVAFIRNDLVLHLVLPAVY
jgi:hypothetical protein